MIAATRSSPECSASDSTPKLSVRITRKVLSETSTSAEATLSSAARFFSFTSSTRAVITVRLDYRTRPPFAHLQGEVGADVNLSAGAGCLENAPDQELLLGRKRSTAEFMQ